MSPKPSPIYVYRCSTWRVVTTKDLLPGDIISLSYKKQQRSKINKTITAAVPSSSSATSATSTTTNTVTSSATKSTTADAVTEGNDKKGRSLTSLDEIIPCDCLLLKGKAVVNEASLTGNLMIMMMMMMMINLCRCSYIILPHSSIMTIIYSTLIDFCFYYYYYYYHYFYNYLL